MNLQEALHEVRTVLKRFAVPVTLAPRKRVTLSELTIELWVSQRKLPLLLRADAIIAPTGPDLKMAFGVAKMIRDMGADAVQYEANRAAPAAPGSAFVGSGARFRYRCTALAVIFDETKRTSQTLLSSAIHTAMRLLREQGAKSVVVPDMTANLLTQPNWITDEQRRETAAVTAKMIVEAVLEAGCVKKVKLWVWEPANVEFYINELDKLKNRRQAVAA